MKHWKYKGRRVLLRNETALTRPDPRSRRHVLVQFDQVGGTYRHELCHHWHRFKRSEFERRGTYSRSHWAKLLHEHCRRGFHSFDFETDFCTGCGLPLEQAVGGVPIDYRKDTLFVQTPKLRETPRVGTIPGEPRR
jgi:ribosomal protein L37E